VLQLRVPEDTLARGEARGDDTRSAWVLRLIDRELVGQPEKSDMLFTKIRFGRLQRSGWSTRSGRSVTSKPRSK